MSCRMWKSLCSFPDKDAGRKSRTAAILPIKCWKVLIPFGGFSRQPVGISEDSLTFFFFNSFHSLSESIPRSITGLGVPVVVSFYRGLFSVKMMTIGPESPRGTVDTGINGEMKSTD
ncbi:unnamed protein product [Natator depressus]